MLLLPNEPRPNWRRGEFYPSPNDTVQLHAWEFLRRNPKFTEEIGPHVERFCAAHPEWFDSPIDYYGWVVRWGMVIAELWKSEECLSFFTRWGIFFTGVPAAVIDFGEPYEPLIGQLSPVEFCDPLIGYRYWQYQKQWELHSNGYVETFDPIYSHAFDLRLPLENQLQQAKEVLERLQKIAKRIAPNEVVKRINDRPALFRRYLRILDARTEGLTFAEIADALGEFDENLIAKQYRKALELRDFGYRRIAFV